VSVERTTGATSRVIAWSIAFWLILLSCLPKFAGLIVNMPRPVMAAALFFNGALMLVAGVQTVASRPITLRASLIVGLSILAALTVPVFPEFYWSLPSWTHQFTNYIISMAVVVAVPLNVLFLLGTCARTRAQAHWRLSPRTFILLGIVSCRAVEPDVSLTKRSKPAKTKLSFRPFPSERQMKT
jgi:xanthine/uracil permease